MARRRRGGNEPPAVRPYDVDGVRTIAVGTVLWAVAFVVLAVFREDLDEQGLGWWLWTCLAGVGLGLLGLEFTRKRRDAIARARLREEADRPDDVDSVADLSPTDDAELPDESHAEPERGRAGPAPAPIEQPPPARAAPEPAQAEPLLQPVDPAQAGLLDVGPPVPAPTPASRRARRAARSVEPGQQDDDEPLLPNAFDPRASTDGRPGGRRARRDDATDDEASDGDSLYRGRRARRY